MCEPSLKTDTKDTHGHVPAQLLLLAYCPEVWCLRHCPPEATGNGQPHAGAGGPKMARGFSSNPFGVQMRRWECCKMQTAATGRKTHAQFEASSAAATWQIGNLTNLAGVPELSGTSQCCRLDCSDANLFISVFYCRIWANFGSDNVTGKALRQLLHAPARRGCCRIMGTCRCIKWRLHWSPFSWSQQIQRAATAAPHRGP